MLETDPQKLDGLRTYIDGKMRRYSLMFSVNGGAFAIAKLMTDANSAKLLGYLSIRQLALGAIVFTILMAIDIWWFGQMMRERFLGEIAFSRRGKLILILLAALLISGWLLVITGG